MTKGYSMVTADRERRLRAIAHVLRSCKATPNELAIMFGVTPRTIYRDLGTLQDEPYRVPLVDTYIRRHEWCVMDLAECE